MTSNGAASTPIGISRGDILDGKYRIERILGRGGMGVVLEVHHMRLGERFALKILSAGIDDQQPELVERFIREARTAAKLRGRYVVRVYDVGELEDLRPFMVMEMLRGEDVAQRLNRGGEFSQTEAVTIALQTCVALAEAHSLGITHRDIKPSNLFLTQLPDGTHQVKVVDFGISKCGDRATTGQNASLTHSGAMLGSPLYMSPEQARGSKATGPQSDIWSLGATLYEMLAKQAPFKGCTLAEILTSLLENTRLDLTEIAPHVEPGLARIVDWCLTISLEQRCPNVAALALALAPFGGPEAAMLSAEALRISGLSASEISPPPRSISSEAVHSSPTLKGLAQSVEPTVRRNPRTLAFILAGASLLLLAGVTLFRNREPQSAIEAASQAPLSAAPLHAQSLPVVTEPMVIPTVIPSVYPTTNPTPSAIHASSNARRLAPHGQAPKLRGNPLSAPRASAAPPPEKPSTAPPQTNLPNDTVWDRL